MSVNFGWKKTEISGRSMLWTFCLFIVIKGQNIWLWSSDLYRLYFGQRTRNGVAISNCKIYKMYKMQRAVDEMYYTCPTSNFVLEHFRSKYYKCMLSNLIKPPLQVPESWAEPREHHSMAHPSSPKFLSRFGCVKGGMDVPQDSYFKVR